MLLALTLVLSPVSAATPSSAAAPEPAGLSAVTDYSPEGQQQDATFAGSGALDALVGTWVLFEGRGGATSVNEIVFTPDDGEGSFVVRLQSRRDEVFDELTCAGDVQLTGRWHIVGGGTGAYAGLRGHGDLSGEAVYSGGDPAADCAGLTERQTLELVGVVTSA